MAEEVGDLGDGRFLARRAAGRQRPDPRGLVEGGRDGAATVGRECDVPNLIGMSFPSLNLLAGFQIPEPHRVAKVRAEQRTASVRRDRDGGTPFVRDPGDTAELLARL